MTVFRSYDHLKWVRGHDCCTCGSVINIHAHHLRIGHGMGMKAPDSLTVPLCEQCHVFGKHAVHTIGSKLENKWFADREIDCLKLAQELASASPYKTHKKPSKTKFRKSSRKIKSRGFNKRIDNMKKKKLEQLLKALTSEKPTKHTSQPVVVCTDKRGVVFGYTKDIEERPITLNNARMCLYWPTSVGGVFGLGDIGPNADTKVSAVLSETILEGVTAIFSVTKEAETAWNTAKIQGR